MRRGEVNWVEEWPGAARRAHTFAHGAGRARRRRQVGACEAAGSERLAAAGRDGGGRGDPGRWATDDG